MKLSAPLRVVWDWNWAPVVRSGRRRKGPGRERASAIAEELARAGVLMLEIGYPDAEDVAGGGVAAVTAGLSGQVSLVVDSAAAAGLGEASSWLRLGIEEVWVDLTPDGGGGKNPGVSRRVSGTPLPGVRIYLTSENWREAAEIVQRAVVGGAAKLSLPILPLFGSVLKSAREGIPSWRDLVEFTDLVEPVLRTHRGVDLRVHNQALWELFRARGFSPSGTEAPGHSGCQAGAALAYIDPEGILYPCAAMPIPLGGVESGTFKSVWSGEENARLRRHLDRIPLACRECRMLESCRGGCRGWAHFLTGEWEGTGPDCSPERESRPELPQ